MGVFDRIGKMMSRRKTPGPSDAERQLVGAMGFVGGTSFYGGWSADRWKQVQHYRGWARICIQAIANRMATTPPTTGRIITSGSLSGSQKQLSKAYKAKSLSPAVRHGSGDFEAFDDDHPLNRLLHQPNPVDVGWYLWFRSIMYYKLTGKCYWWKPRNGLGLPAELWVLPSQWITPLYGRSTNWIDSYVLRTNRTGQPIYIQPDEIIEFTDPSPIDLRDGFSALQACDLWLDTQYSIDRSRLASFKNGARPGLAVELGEKYSEPTDEELERVRQKFFNKYGGEQNDGATVVTPPGAKITPWAFNPKEMAYLESGESIRDAVCSAFGVPYPIANIVGGATYENSDQAKRTFYEGTLNPIRDLFGQVGTKDLARMYDESAVMFWRDETPEDPKQVNDDINTDFACGAITSNQICEIRGREPFDGGDQRFIRTGFVPLTDDMTEEVKVKVPKGKKTADDDATEKTLSWAGHRFDLPQRNGYHGR